ncbi:type IV pilin protein [Psychrobacter lutiphocae]|uniref:type IV pilin protein n=1 Tax=Psychrobacter lutiphocae TaxID=540500 RepID=UPI00037E93DF|nr:prepilin-type N-terminal cleavage/methylation domain-containing protein [Psychrobacter lutiphocae]
MSWRLPHDTRSMHGYGILELLIVVILIGVLSSIAYASYQKNNINARRVQMMVVLQNLAMNIHAQKLIQANYADVALVSIFPTAQWTVSTGQTKSDKMAVFDYPQGAPVLYKVSLSPVTDGSLTAGKQLGSAQWQLIATPDPDGIMHQDGILSLNFEGRKCHRDKCRYDDSWNQDTP